MMIGRLGWEKIDLIRALKHLAAMIFRYEVNGTHRVNHFNPSQILEMILAYFTNVHSPHKSIAQVGPKWRPMKQGFHRLTISTASI